MKNKTKQNKEGSQKPVAETIDRSRYDPPTALAGSFVKKQVTLLHKDYKIASRGYEILFKNMERLYC